MVRRAGLIAGIALSVLFTAGWSSPLFAASRSRTINVSCVVPATVQMLQSAVSASQDTELSFQATEAGVAVNTNLGKELDLSQSTSTIGGQNITTYSITVL